MPAAVPWKRVVTAILLVSLVFPTAALAQTGGLGPRGPRRRAGRDQRHLLGQLPAVVAVVFVLVEAALILFIVRFRRRRTTGADEEGPQIHGNTAPRGRGLLSRRSSSRGSRPSRSSRRPTLRPEPASSANVLTVEVDAHQFYWLYRYPNGAVSLDTLYLPVDRPVALELNAADVNHSWWVPELTGKRDAIPGRTNLNFEPRTIGTYEGQCAEHCGVQHAVMRTTVEVLSAQEFDRWLDEERARCRRPRRARAPRVGSRLRQMPSLGRKRPGRADRRRQRDDARA